MCKIVIWVANTYLKTVFLHQYKDAAILSLSFILTNNLGILLCFGTKKTAFVYITAQILCNKPNCNLCFGILLVICFQEMSNFLGLIIFGPKIKCSKCRKKMARVLVVKALKGKVIYLNVNYKCPQGQSFSLVT